MSAVTTKKPGANAALALTFPAVFSDVYAASGAPMEDAREAPLPPTDEMPGGVGLQDAYHQQKLADARAMVFAGLAARRAAEKRMMTSHANYFGMPAPVLGQRRFANPSLGNQPGAIDSARRTMMGDGAPFHCMGGAMAIDSMTVRYKSTDGEMRGGVLRSAQGQAYGRAMLQRRIKQLDAIDAADATFSEVTEAVPAGEGPSTPSTSQELAVANALDKLDASTRGDQETALRFFVDDFGNLVKTITTFAPIADREQLSDIAVTVEDATVAFINRRALGPEIAERAEAAAAAPPGAAAPARRPGPGAQIPAAVFEATREPLAARLRALASYVRQMIENVDLSVPEKRALSRNLIRSTGLSTLASRRGARDIIRSAAAVRRMPARQGVRMDMFYQPARPREDDEADEVDAGAGAGARRFARDQRQVYGARAGAFIGEAPPAAPRALPGRRQGAVGIPVEAAVREAPMPGFADAAPPVGEGRFRRRLFRR